MQSGLFHGRKKELCTEKEMRRVSGGAVEIDGCLIYHRSF